MKKHIFLIFFIILCFFLRISNSYCFENIIVAKVDDKIITSYDVETRINMMKSFKIIDENADQEKVKEEIIETLINEEIAFLESQRINMEFTENDVTEVLANMAANSNTTIESLLEEIKSLNINVSHFKKRIHANLILGEFAKNYMQDKVYASNLEVAEQKYQYKKIMDDLHSKNHNQNQNEDIVTISEIKIKKEENENENDFKQRSEAIYSSLLNGENFQNLASKFGDENIKSNNGILGSFKINQLNDFYLSIIKSMKIGDISKPLDLGNEIVIIKLINLEKSKNKIESNTYKHTEPEKLFIVKEQIIENKKNKYFNKFISRIQSNHFIQIFVL